MQRAFRPPAFGVELLALEFKPMGVAIERFFQRSDDDAREPCLEAAKSGAAAGLELLRLVRRRRLIFRILRLRAKLVTPSAASRS